MEDRRRRPLPPPCRAAVPPVPPAASRSINRMLIEQGHARWYSRFGGENLGFAAAEEQARSNRRGFWRSRHQVAPWDHRAAQRRRQSQPQGCFGLLVAFLILLLIVVLAGA